MKFTKWFNFKKPDPLDTVNINDLNDSFDMIDEKLKLTSDENKNLLTMFKNLIINAGNSNAEVAASRGNFDYLPKRLDNFDSSLEQKLNKDGIVTMANMGQDVKEAMTGGSVAVVGKNTILTENIVDKQVTPLKTNFVKILGDLQLLDYTQGKLNQYYKNTGAGQTGGSAGKVAIEFIPEVGATYVLFGVWANQTFVYNQTTSTLTAISSLSTTTYYSNMEYSKLDKDVAFMVTIPEGTTKLYFTGYVDDVNVNILKPMIFKTNKQIHPIKYINKDDYYDKQIVIDYLYEPLAEKSLNKWNKIITVKKDGTGDFTKVVDAINSIKDAGVNNRYEVHIYDGDYDLLQEFGGLTWANSITHDNGERQGLNPPDYVDLIGHGIVNLKMEMSDNYVTYDFSRCVSTINLYKNSRVENINFTAKNTRYVCHEEGGPEFYELNVKNCTFKHLGNKSGMWVSCGAWGAGTASGCTVTFENCIFDSPFNAWGMHNNENQKSCTIILDGCVFKGGTKNADITFEYYKLNTNRNKVFIKNCIGEKAKLVQVLPTLESVPSNNVWDIYNFVDKEVIIGSDN